MLTFQIWATHRQPHNGIQTYRHTTHMNVRGEKKNKKRQQNWNGSAVGLPWTINVKICEAGRYIEMKQSLWLASVLCVSCISSEGDVSFLVSWDYCIEGCGKMNRTKTRCCLAFSKMANERWWVSMSRIVVLIQGAGLLPLIYCSCPNMRQNFMVTVACEDYVHPIMSRSSISLERVSEKRSVWVWWKQTTWSQIVGPSWQPIFCWRQPSRLLSLCSAFVRVQDS